MKILMLPKEVLEETSLNLKQSNVEHWILTNPLTNEQKLIVGSLENPVELDIKDLMPNLAESLNLLVNLNKELAQFSKFKVLIQKSITTDPEPPTPPEASTEIKPVETVPEIPVLNQKKDDKLYKEETTKPKKKWWEK